MPSSSLAIRHGPFTILEGNNRMVAYAASGAEAVIPRVYVGVSPSPCIWHGPDRKALLVKDERRPTRSEAPGGEYLIGSLWPWRDKRG